MEDAAAAAAAERRRRCAAAEAEAVDRCSTEGKTAAARPTLWPGLRLTQRERVKNEWRPLRGGRVRSGVRGGAAVPGGWPEKRKVTAP